MEYIGNRPNPNPTNPNPYQYDDGGYWWNYNNPYGAYDPYGYNYPVTSWEQQTTQSGGTAPPQTNEGQTVETPGGTAPAGTPQDPVFRTDVIGNAPTPLEYLPTNIGNLNPYLNEYLASLPQGGGGTGGGGANFNVTGTDFMDPSYPFPGKYGDDLKFDPNLPPSTFTAEGTYKPPPDIVGWPKFEFNPNPPPSDPVFRTEVTGFPDPEYPFPGKYPWGGFTPNLPPGTKPPPEIKGPKITTPDRTKPTQPPPPQTQQPGGKQQQQPGVGKLLAALPMLAAFQGGTTTTPAPYAHLGPHTPVKSVFGPQGPGKRIPSIGQLLAGVR